MNALYKGRLFLMVTSTLMAAACLSLVLTVEAGAVKDRSALATRNQGASPVMADQDFLHKRIQWNRILISKRFD